MNKQDYQAEEQLRKLRENYNNHLPPEDFEQRMRTALASAAPRKKLLLPSLFARKLGYSLASILLILLLLGSLNYNALAYYGKKITGYEALVSEHIAALHEAGEGQQIDKTVTLNDGTLFIVDALVSDENQFILYYRLTNPQGVPMTLREQFYVDSVKGFLTNSSMTHGTSMENEDGTEVLFTQSFKPVSPWAKKLKLIYRQPIEEYTAENKELEIPYDPNQAMATTLKKRINKTVKVDEGQILFKEIIATPTETIIKGKLKDVTTSSPFNSLGSIYLIADGQQLEMEGSGLRRDMKGHTFELRYAPLPNNIKELAIDIEKFTGYVELQQNVELSKLLEGEVSQVVAALLDSGEDLTIHNVTQKSNYIEVDLSTNADVQLKQVQLMSVQGAIQLQSTINEQLEKEADGTIMKYRTLRFELGEAVNQNLELQSISIGGMYWNKPYDIEIEIPL